MVKWAKHLESEAVFTENKGTVRLETTRLNLRRFVPGDLEPVYYNCWSDREVTKWTSYAPMDCLADVKEKADMFTDGWLRAYDRPNRYSWAIEEKASGEVIGRVFGMHPDAGTREVELTYELGRAWWNKGLMTEAVGAVIDYLFRENGFARICAYHADKNPASGRVMQKCGMAYENTVPQGCRCNGGIFDKVNYAISSEDYFRASIRSASR